MRKKKTLMISLKRHIEKIIPLQHLARQPAEESSEPEVTLQTSCGKSVTGERPPWTPILLAQEPQQVVSIPA